MRTNSQIDPGPKGKSFEKPPTFFKNDQDIALWVRRAMNKLEPSASAVAYSAWRRLPRP